MAELPDSDVEDILDRGKYVKALRTELLGHIDDLAAKVDALKAEVESSIASRPMATVSVVFIAGLIVGAILMKILDK